MAVGSAACIVAFSANAKVSQNFDSIYAGLGIGGSFLTNDGIHHPVHDSEYPDREIPIGSEYVPPAKWSGRSKPKSRLVGSFVVGGGKVFNNIYVGAEFLMDFPEKRDFEARIRKSGDALIHNIGGFIPQINAKLGYDKVFCTKIQ